MKIYIVTSPNQQIGLGIARILEADVALVEKDGGITAAYILTTAGDNLMRQTMLRKHKSEETSLDFYPIPFILESAVTFLKSKFEIELVSFQPTSKSQLKTWKEYRSILLIVLGTVGMLSGTLHMFGPERLESLVRAGYLIFAGGIGIVMIVEGVLRLRSEK